MKIFRTTVWLFVIVLSFTQVRGALVTDPNDGRSWQGADIGTFAQLYYGSNTLANRQQVVTNQLLDDGIFDPTGYTTGTLIAASGIQGYGYSTDSTGTGDYNYVGFSGGLFSNWADAGNGIDNKWFQTDSVIGHTVFDLGFQATKAAVFNTIDHGPLPQEAIESTVYLSNDLTTWTQGVVERVWLEGFQTNLGIKWDGFVYAVGTGTNNTFRYASIVWGGQGALQADGDNEINGVMGLQSDFSQSVVPEPVSCAIWSLIIGSCGIAVLRKRRNRSRSAE
jgi:hypothetical protein